MGVTSNIVSRFTGKVTPTIVSRLEGKQADLNNSVSSARMRVSSLSDQITDLNIGAESDAKKAAAIKEALSVLNKAGVEV